MVNLDCKSSLLLLPPSSLPLSRHAIIIIAIKSIL